MNSGSRFVGRLLAPGPGFRARPLGAPGVAALPLRSRYFVLGGRASPSRPALDVVVVGAGPGPRGRSGDGSWARFLFLACSLLGSYLSKHRPSYGCNVPSDWLGGI